MPPFLAIDYRRNKKDKKDKISLFFLFEGSKTEPTFFKSLIDNSSIFDERKYNIKIVDKTSTDSGITNIKKMIEKSFKDIVRKEGFRSGYDKILIFFDLDIFKNDQKEMNKLVDFVNKNNDFILLFTNPSIELFLLLCVKDSYGKLIEKNKKEIIENKWINNKRYIVNLFEKETHINPKKYSNDLKELALNFDIGIYQETFINHYLDNAANNLTSNIGYVLNKIKEGKIEEIRYFNKQ